MKLIQDPYAQYGMARKKDRLNELNHRTTGKTDL